MKNTTLLRLNIREVLALHCTAVAEHNLSGRLCDEACDKCEEMEDALLQAVENWRLRAYKTTKGKI
jgi:hypothetical protein